MSGNFLGEVELQRCYTVNMTSARAIPEAAGHPPEASSVSGEQASAEVGAVCLRLRLFILSH